MMYRNIARRHPEGGMTLLECLLFSGVFSIFAGGLMVMFLSVTRTMEAGNNRAALLQEIESARAACMAVIQEANGTLPAVGAYQAGEHQLILDLPPAPGQTRPRRAVIGCVGVADKPGVLLMAESGGTFTPLSHKVFRVPLKEIRFQVDGRRVTVWFDVNTPTRKREKETAPVQFSATFRGVQ